MSRLGAFVGDAKDEWRREWGVAFGVTVGLGTGVAVWPSVSSLFILPLQHAFGWSRGEIAFAYNAAVTSAISAPILGRAIDRFGLGKILFPGMIISGLIYCGLASLTGSLIMFYALSILMSMAHTTTSGLAYTRLIAASFEKSRGVALAVTRIGSGLITAIMPSLLFWVITRHGWRSGYLALAFLGVVIAVPIVWLALRGRPALFVPARDMPNSVAAQHSWLSLIRNPRVLQIALAAGLSFGPTIALLYNMQPIFIGQGASAVKAAMLIGLIGTASAVGTIATGAIIDRVWAPAVGFVINLLSASGCLILAFSGGHAPIAVLAVAAVLIGLNQGGEVDLVAYVVSRYMSLSIYATVYGMVLFGIAMLIAFFSNVVAISFDYFGSYQIGLLCCAGSLIAAACAYILLGRYPEADLGAGKDESGASARAIH